LADEIVFQAFDVAVNHGIGTALRLLQRAAGVADDGHVGPVTRAALKAVSRRDLIDLYAAERLDFWTRLSTWPTFGKGWWARVENVSRAIAAFGDALAALGQKPDVGAALAAVHAA